MDGAIDFAAVEAHLRALGRPLAAFCACELRSPAPFTEQGFVDFNRRYVLTLERWGLYRDGINPVARTNVCPLFDPPPEPALHAFSYTVPSAADAHGTFVIAARGLARHGLAWHVSRPPVVDIEVEMDVRRTAADHLV